MQQRYHSNSTTNVRLRSEINNSTKTTKDILLLSWLFFYVQTSMRIKPFIPALIWLIIILVLSGYPGKNLPKAPFDEFDKLVHLIIYAILSFLSMLGFSMQPKSLLLSKNLQYVSSVLFSVLAGGLIELLQHYVFINRYGDWLDFIANSLGALAGVVGFWLISKKLNV
ncbi:MAG: VanZ family protein [Vicingaceae bacterium]|nr:VanZ family protein [Vicingaceae bacterium]